MKYLLITKAGTFLEVSEITSDTQEAWDECLVDIFTFTGGEFMRYDGSGWIPVATAP